MRWEHGRLARFLKRTRNSKLETLDRFILDSQTPRLLGFRLMTFLLYLSGLLLISAVAVFVAAPLFNPERESHGTGEQEGQAARWEKQKTDAYAALKEAEFDQQMGKLTEEDYRILREKYEARAIEALAQLDHLPTSGEGQDRR